MLPASTPALAKWPAKGLLTRVGFLEPNATWIAFVAVGFNRLHHSDTVVRHIEHSHGNGHTVFRENVRHADFLPDHTMMPSLSLIVFSSTPATIGRDRFHEKAKLVR